MGKLDTYIKLWLENLLGRYLGDYVQKGGQHWNYTDLTGFRWDQKVGFYEHINDPLHSIPLPVYETVWCHVQEHYKHDTTVKSHTGNFI
jgi:hypothetical protein